MTTPILSEAGSQTLGLVMMSSAKAFNHFSIPNEFYIYPSSGHVPDRPQAIAEVALRNFDWFMFWLMGRERTEIVSATSETADALLQQYARWHHLRTKADFLELQR